MHLELIMPATNVKFSGSAYVRDVLQLHVGDFISSLIRAVEILMKVLFQARLSVFGLPIVSPCKFIWFEPNLRA